MEASRPYNLRLVVHSRDTHDGSGEISPHAAKLCFQEEYSDDAAIAEAVELAKRSDVSIIFGGRTHEHESEGFDLETIELAEPQRRMIKEVARASAKTVLVLHGGNPIDVSEFVDEVDVVLAAHFPGQEGPQAITDVITGVVNPSGRLATSWPLRLDAECVPTYADFPATDKGKGPELEYAEGLQMGYRHPDARSHSRYPFGFGLSYSTFPCSNLIVSAVSDPPAAAADEHSRPAYSQQMIRATVQVHNAGPRPGHHVVQLYSEAPVQPGVWRPRAELKAFTKVWLEVGDTVTAELLLPRRDVCGVWDERASCWRAMSGLYTFVVEGCRTELEMDDDATWTGL